MEESLADVIGILVMINVLVVTPMIGAPTERRVFEGRRSENQRGELDRPFGLE